MNETQQQNFAEQVDLLPSKQETPANKLRKFYRTVGNKAVAAALSIQSSYTRSASPKVMAVATVPGNRR